jgi:hypothetical protein
LDAGNFELSGLQEIGFRPQSHGWGENPTRMICFEPAGRLLDFAATTFKNDRGGVAECVLGPLG